jgi:hypothetical protein
MTDQLPDRRLSEVYSLEAALGQPLRRALAFHDERGRSAAQSPDPGGSCPESPPKRQLPDQLVRAVRGDHSPPKGTP